MLKKVISLIVSIMVLSSFYLTVYADFYTNYMTVFGNSVSAGYGLDDYSSQDLYSSRQNFVNKIAAQNKLASQKKYFNFSEENASDYDVAEQITNIDGDFLRRSDSIIISMFQKSMTDTFCDIFINAAQSKSSELDELGISYESDSSENIFEDIIKALKELNKKRKSSPLAEECYNEIEDAFSNENFQAVMQIRYSELKSELREVLTLIYDNENSNANVYILDTFNPLGQIDIGDVFFNFFENFCIEIMGFINDEADYNPNKVHVIDVYNAFHGKESENTNNSSYDFNVNKNGHSKIAELIENEMKNAEKNSENTISYSEKSEKLSSQGVYSTENSSPPSESKPALTEEQQNAARHAYLGVVCTIFIGFAAIASIASFSYNKKRK